MSMYRKEWDCCGDVSETNGWEPEACPFCATPPSPSTAPEVPPFPESFGLADVPHAMNTPDDWDADYRATWQKLQVAEINLSQMRAYARKLRAALASRPAEVDDEGLLPLRTPEFCAGDLESGEPVYTAEQYRHGQRDAVAAYKRQQVALQQLADQAQELDMGYGAAPSHTTNKEK